MSLYGRRRWVSMSTLTVITIEASEYISILMCFPSSNRYVFLSSLWDLEKRILF